VEK
jgi:hypothetical protein